MSEARKCDRCGKYYDRIAFRNYISPYNLGDHKKDIDLCDDCVESFNKWLKMWEPLKDYVENDIEAVEEASKAVECRLENLPEFKPHKSSIITEVPEEVSEGCTDDIDIFETGKMNLREAMDRYGYLMIYDKTKTNRAFKAIIRNIMPFKPEKVDEWTVADFYLICRDYKPEYKFGKIIKYHPITLSDIFDFKNVGTVIANDIYRFYKWIDTLYKNETAPEPEEATEELPNNVDGLIISEDKIQYFKDTFDKKKDIRFDTLFLKFCSAFGCENTRGQSAQRYLNVFLRNTVYIRRDSRFLGKENKFYKAIINYHDDGRLTYIDIMHWRGVGKKAAAWINDFVTHYCLYYEKYILEQED